MAVIAGVLGMNFEENFQRFILFWWGVAAMIVLSTGTTLLARHRRWIYSVVENCSICKVLIQVIRVEKWRRQEIF